MFLYNTKTRKKESFTPLDGKTVKMYSCGPTVYSTAHIGNLRAYIFVDVLKKSLQLCGFELFDVMNTTDVGHLTDDGDAGDDKVEQAAKREKISPAEITKKYTEEFLRDTAMLNIKPPRIFAPATKYINQMIEFVKGLEAKGFTYTTRDGVYFDSSRFGNYAAFSGANIEGNLAGARVDLLEKRNASDFALWKFCGPNVIQKWDSPWGVGCPGWHIECSAIAMHYLGETFDIHTGGVDAVPIHHTNEIAQTESLTGKPMCTFWCHNEFMMVNGGKMGKSLGNAYTLSNLQERGYEALAFRYFVLLGGYRSILNFTFEAMDSASAALNNLREAIAKHKNGLAKTDCSKYLQEFKAAVEDDLNTPKAVAVLWRMVKEAASAQVYKTAMEMDKVLSLDLHKNKSDEPAVSLEIPDDIKQLAEKRLEAKKARDFAAADALREKISDAGWEIIDTKDSYEIKKK